MGDVAQAHFIANCYKFKKEIRKWDSKCSFSSFFHLPFTFSFRRNTHTFSETVVCISTQIWTHFNAIVHLKCPIIMEWMQNISLLIDEKLTKETFGVEKASNMKYCSMYFHNFRLFYFRCLRKTFSIRKFDLTKIAHYG